ncbi:alpha-N-acetylgalactosaminide alpha-2,6-sialyltransferase 5 isoform X2 [Leopardus geoffroyi]|uniref:alpha-N-acetylgalactosaminide alpha-2,6-sialyltransferase 5 isoform X2 n=1 Tax=Leopardus geoffroyi TaxID=46844 RepID=UPI001E262A15|nr:alpha-N-acetylgalactosaminide alpha-2,6-sialyltransferase 5 isoform X2 [Leopardus geoffroyi]
MKTLMRHGLAVCLALTTMCTSLLLVYSSLGGQKERPPQQQQQAGATGSAQPSAESSPPSRPRIPAAPRPLDGYLGVADHKVTARSPARAPPSLGTRTPEPAPFPGAGRRRDP